METSQYLSGNYAPVETEVTATNLTVIGSLPPELNGRFLRNGPNPVAAPEPSTYHWFTGDGMVHGIRLSDGRADWYRNRWVRSGDVAQALGEQPRPGPTNEGMDFAANTNVIGHAARTFAIVEAGGVPYELDYELETIGACQFNGALTAGYTAHPKRDPETDELFAISYFWGWGNDMEVTVMDPSAHITSSRRVAFGGPSSVHDTAITEKWIVLLDLPVLLDFEMAGQGSSFPYRWFDDHPARVGLLPRHGDSTDVVWHDVSPCYVFHTMNAYDTDSGGIVVDVVRHNSMFRTIYNGPAEGPPTFERWHIDGLGGPVKEERLDDRGQEFPRIDERRLGRQHRIGYAVAAREKTDIVGMESELIRHDLLANTSTVRKFRSGATIGEAVFVPRSATSQEGDGWVMTLVHQAGTDTSDLYVLNAQDIDGEPQAIVQLPQRVPAGFHGNWIPDVI